MRRLRTQLSLLAVAAASVATFGGGAQSHAATISFCKGPQLAGSFKAVYGSAGAGNISYRLTLANVSAKKCSLTGLPVVQLLGKKGGKLPTKVLAEFPGALTAILVTLAHGRYTHATARFSPDVPGVGEQAVGQCEPTSYSLRVSAKGGGTTTVKITPETPVCEHGRFLFTAYGK